jgi:hypothetical protein
VVESPGPAKVEASQLEPAGPKSIETAFTTKTVGTTIWMQPMSPPPPPALVFVATKATDVGLAAGTLGGVRVRVHELFLARAAGARPIARTATAPRLAAKTRPRR